MFSFLWPLCAFLLPLPWIVRHILPAQKQEDTSTSTHAIYVPFFNRLERIPSAQVKNAPKTSAKLPAFWGWVFLVVACMRPAWIGDPLPFNQPAHNVILTMDVSGSMGEQDFNMYMHPMTRLDMLKEISTDFVQQRQGDNLGLVIFGSEAYTYAPLSPDIKTLKNLIGEIGLGIAGEQTALGEALALAVQAGTSAPADSQIIILLSDGYANAGQVKVEEAIQLAQNQKVKVYTVGIGSDAQMVKNFFGTFQVNPSLDLDEKTLKKIADETGGKYFRAKTSEDMKEIYQIINRLEPILGATEFIRPQKGLFYWPLILSLFFFGIAFMKQGGEK